MTEFIGRLQERQQLRAVLEDRAPRLVVLRGPSGVGKTALVEQALRELPSPGPIVGRAKYPDDRTNLGLRPVVDALSQAVDDALGRLYDPAEGAASLRQIVGAQYDALVAAGFNPAGLAGCIPSSLAAALLSREGTARLVDALTRVLQWLDGFALPVALFIDDWHRAPNEAVGFVDACVRRGGPNALKLILAARGESAMRYPQQASIVDLAPLPRADQLELLVRLLGGRAEAQAVMDWLGDHASGLPFDLVEIALALRRQGAIVGVGQTLRVDAARAATIDHRDINQIIVQRARSLPAKVMRLGIGAALWGDRIDLEALATCLSEPFEAARAAADMLRSNGLLRLEGDEISFPHDRIRASLLKVPESAERQRLAHAMADALLAAGTPGYRQTALRLKLEGGLDGLQEGRLAGLLAAEAASSRLAAQFDLATDFAEAAWSIFRRLGDPNLADRGTVLREACFASAHRRETEATRERCAMLIASAANDAELADAYECGIVAMRLAGTAADAWALACEGVARFGVRLPGRISGLHLAMAALGWKLAGLRAWRRSRYDAPTEQAVTSFADTVGYIAWERDPRFAAYNAIRWATRARLNGYNSAFWLSVDAFISAALKQYRAAAEFGDRTLAVLPELTVRRGMTVYRAVSFGKAWRDPRAALTFSNPLVYDLCLAEGDLVGAAYAVRNEALWSWRMSPTLADVAATLEQADAKAERLGDATTRAEIVRLAELVRRLRQPEPLASRLPDELVHGKFVEPPMTVVEFLGVAEDWPAILRIADEFRGRRHTFDTHPGGVSWRFYENLARLKSGLPPSKPDLKFIERAAGANPTDQLGRFLLLRAEQGYRRGDKDCLRAYAAALEAMEKGSSRAEIGLAGECAAAAARALGDGVQYERFRAAAAATWSGWGAFGKLAGYKTDQLDEPIRARLADAEAQAAMARRGEQAKSRFLAEMGHELRTPLQAMQGLLDLAAERPEELNLAEIREVFGSLKSVVDDLTELGALGAEAPLNVRTTDLAGLLKSELALVQDAASKKGLVLAADFPELQGQFFGIDPDRTRQVMRNLLWNAVKYTERGGVTVNAGIAPDRDGLARIALAVEDTGPGIPEERLLHLFEPFDRAGRADSKGLGLGLSLSRRIAERMGGSLTAANREVGGSRFVFSFVADRREPPAQQQAAPKSLNILIVEDTVLVRRLMARLLSLDGHVVAEAGDLAQGVEQARRSRPDLLILDLHLPDGDGLALLEQWPPDRERPPTIVLTAAVTRETEQRVASAGATVLRKPIGAADLRSAIVQAHGLSEIRETPTGIDEEMASLAQEAREEIENRAIMLADLVRSGGLPAEIQLCAHKLAGLAAQFDEPLIAEAADRLERACSKSMSPKDELGALECAIERLCA